jgi:hypothetical protein
MLSGFAHVVLLLHMGGFRSFVSVCFLAHYCLVIFSFSSTVFVYSVWIEFLWVCSCTSLVSFFSTVLHFALESIHRIFELFVHAHLL